MAAGVNLCDVRIEETLKIRIGRFKILRELLSRIALHYLCDFSGEAKNLPARKEPRYSRNCYCVVTLDQEEVFRTSTVEKSLW